MSNQLSSYRKSDKKLLDDASTGSQMPPRVSIGDNKFTLIDPSGQSMQVPFLKDGPALDVVFVDRNEHMSKLYWGDKAYNPNDLAPPVCFSDNGVAPSAMAQDPQSPICASCPHNIIGSAVSQISGARIKACGDLKKLAVVVKGFQGVYQFTIKPGSFKAWNNYTNYLRLQKLPNGGRPDLSDIVTRIRFSGQGILSFDAVELVEDGSALAQQVIGIWDRNQESDLTGMMVGRYDPPAQGVLSAPTNAQAQRQPGPAGTPPPQQGAGLFFQPAQQAPVAPGPAPAPEDVKRGRRTTAKKNSEERAPVMPAQPTAPHGMQAPQPMPADVSSRLDSLFKLPPVK